MIGAMVAIAIIAVVAITTSQIPSWLSVALFVAVVAQLVYSRQQSIKVGALALEALRAKGPMTVSQLGQALARPDDRVAIIAALARLRTRGAVTREELAAGTATPDARDSHRYTAAA
jgi:hypothetical protein